MSDYVDLGDGRFSYRRDQLWRNGDEHHLGQLVEFRVGDPSSRAIVEAVDEERVVFQMLGRPVIDVTGGRLWR